MSTTVCKYTYFRVCLTPYVNTLIFVYVYHPITASIISLISIKMVKMEIRYCVHILIILKHFLTASCTDVQCDPAEIGTNHSISCSSSVVSDSIVWSRSFQQSFTIMWECLTNTTCVPFLPFFVTSYNAKMEYINGAYRSTLVIYNIRLSPDVIFKCSIDKQPEVNVCNPLEFYNKPERIKCNESLVISEQNTISIMCVLTKVYPAAKMLLNSSGLSNTVTCVNDTSSTVGPIKCQSDIPVAGMKAGVNFIDVLIYPDVTSGEKFGVKKQLNITLTFPTPSLGQDCLNIFNTTQGYIKQGTSANCTCYVKTKGVPPGGVKWFYSNGSDVGIVSSSGSAVLQVMFSGKELSRNDMCVGVSVLGTDLKGSELSFKNAYGPEQMSLFTRDSSVMYTSCSPNTTINIICSVPRQSVAPEPSVTIRVSNGESLVINPNHNSSDYIYMSSYRPTFDGVLTLTCEAFNSIFKEVKQSVTFTVYIAGPPQQPPSLSIRQRNFSGTNVKSLEPQKEGSDIEITCRVSGGFPNTYNLTVSCDGIYTNSSSNSDVVSMTIENVGRQLNGKQCLCKAEHVTSCYVNNTSSVTRNITYPTVIQLFTANSKGSSLIVSENSQVTFFCMVDSNPPASVEISKTETITTNMGRVNFTKLVMCQDSGEYYCKAHNSQFTQDIRNSIALYVQCPLQLRNLTDENKIIPAHMENNVMILIEIVGYPAPTFLKLFKSINGSAVQVFSTASLNILDKKYQGELENYNLPIGSVNITVHNLTTTDFSNYSVKIYNGLGNELTYNFKINEDLTSSKTSTSVVLPAAIGAAIASVVIVAIVVLIYIKRNELKILKINSCLRRTNTHENENYENTRPTSTSTPDPPAGRGYEEIDLVQNYDKLQHTYDNLDQNPNYSQISVPTVYDKVDASEINVAFQYDSVNSQEKGNYQNFSHSNTLRFPIHHNMLLK